MRGASEAERLEERALDEATLFRGLVERSPDMLSLHSVTGMFLYVSPACRRLLGYEPDELVGRPVCDLIHPPDVPAFRRSQDRLAETGESSPVTYRARRRDGTLVWLETVCHTVQHPGTSEVREVLAISRDVTERSRMAAELRESEHRFRQAFGEAPIGMALVAPDGRWLQVNRSVCQMMGYTEEELLRRTFQEITHPDDLEADLELTRKVLAGELDRFQMEKRYLHRDGHEVPALLSVSLVRSAQGEPLHFISQIQDITERKHFEAQLHEANHRLQELATVDPLTELKNRRFFREALEAEFVTAVRHREPLSIILLDLDHFKDLNDSHGHAEGDRRLQQVARILRSQVRAGDVVARYGGEEFAVILPRTAMAGACTLALRCRAAIEKYPWEETGATASFGVATMTEATTDEHALVEAADQALYCAKAQGRNQVVCANTEELPT